MKKLFLLDGTALIYRSYYAFIKNPLKTKDGREASAIFGTANIFLKLVQSFDCRHCAVAFDRKEKTFRHQLDVNYKANRPPMPEPLVAQLEPVHEFFTLAGIPVLSLAGYEADDLIATVAAAYSDRYEVVMVTPDKDYVQLLDDNVSIWDPGKERTLTIDNAEELTGVPPRYFVDYLALMGDASDNIPGVPGVGEKTAKELIATYGGLDSIYQNINQIKPAWAKKLAAGEESARLSYRLATIDRQVPMLIPGDDDLVFEPEHLAATLDFLQAWDLKTLAGRIDKYRQSELEFVAAVPETAPIAHTLPTSPQLLPFTPVLVDTPELWDEMLQALAPMPVLALDTETTGLEAHRAEIVGLSLCGSAQTAYYVPLGHKMSENLAIDTVIAALPGLLAGKVMVGHNIKYDMQVLQNYNLELTGTLWDTMLASYLLNPAALRHSLDNCALEELEHTMIPITNLIGTGKNQVGFEMVPVEAACPYAAEDAWAAFCLYGVYRPRLHREGLEELFTGLEMPLVPVLAALERTGVFIDTEFLKNLSREFSQRLTELTTRLYELAGMQFNLNSPKQLADLLFNRLGINPKKKTKTGYSTDWSVLEELRDEHPLIPLLMEYRHLAKLEATYVSALPRLIDPVDQRVHSSFNQAITSTGRLSSNNPNLQNIPVRSEVGREIRRAFIPQQPGWQILSVDYSQIELRLLAVMSHEPNLVQAFNNNEDIHTRTAGLIFNLPPEQVGKAERSRAKTINFGILYGMGSRKLATELGISLKEAALFIENYFERLPGIRAFVDGLVEQARQNGYARTIFGRILPLPQINGTNPRLKAEAERVAVNMPIQGSAADIIKRAMISVHTAINGRSDVKMLMQVHDELVFEVAPAALAEVTALVTNLMEEALPPQYAAVVPLKAEAGCGDNWLAAH